jgi:hypothetical protein
MKDLKQKDLIPILGTKSFVSKILNGTAKIPVKSMDALCQFLGIPVEALIPKSNNQYNEMMVVAEPVVKYKSKKARKK